MAKFILKESITIEKLKEIIKKELGSDYNIKLGEKRLTITEGSLKGCMIKHNIKSGRTICSGPYRFIPSVWFHLLILVGTLAVFSIIMTLALGSFNIEFGGAIPLLLAFYLIRLPSKKISQRLVVIMKHLTDSAGIPSKQDEEIFVCTSCNAEVSENDMICAKCGADLSEIIE